jgi:hypothetical protein
MEKQKELIAATNQELSEIGQEFTNGQVTEQRNIVIPKILIQQGLSKFVTEGVAKMGDVCDSLTGEILAAWDGKANGYKEPVRFIPFTHEDIWIIAEKNGDQFKYVGQEKVTKDNENRPWEDVVNNKIVKFTRCLYIYVLLEKDTSMPYILSFKSTSLRAGKILYTQMYVKNQVPNGKGGISVVPPLKVIELQGIKEQNDKGTFIVAATKACENTPMDIIQKCISWNKIIKSGAVKADQSDEVSEAPSQPLSNVGNQF